VPYLLKEDRDNLDIRGLKARKGGELNYQISKLLNDFVVMKGLSYATVNEAMGAIESAKLEFYRRVAAPYEDKKCIENGDVYTFL
jgi:hypothetical protein